MDNMPRCEECDRDFASDAALLQHNADKHRALSKHDMKEMRRKEKEEAKRQEQDKASKKRKLKTATIIAAVTLGVIGLAVFVVFLPKPQGQLPQLGPVGSTHQHADFKIYINGVLVDFSSAKYQVRAREVHVENGDGDIIHKHATGVTVGHFLRTLGFRLNSTCITTDSGEPHCSNEDASLKQFVKKPNSDWQQADLSDYEIRDLDKYLITYGSETDLTEQQNSVTDKARIESASGRSMPL